MSDIVKVGKYTLCITSIFINLIDHKQFSQTTNSMHCRLLCVTFKPYRYHNKSFQTIFVFFKYYEERFLKTNLLYYTTRNAFYKGKDSFLII